MTRGRKEKRCCLFRVGRVVRNGRGVKNGTDRFCAWVRWCKSFFFFFVVTRGGKVKKRCCLLTVGWGTRWLLVKTKRVDLALGLYNCVADACCTSL